MIILLLPLQFYTIFHSFIKFYWRAPPKTKLNHSEFGVEQCVCRSWLYENDSNISPLRFILGFALKNTSFYWIITYIFKLYGPMKISDPPINHFDPHPATARQCVYTSQTGGMSLSSRIRWQTLPWGSGWDIFKHFLLTGITKKRRYTNFILGCWGRSYDWGLTSFQGTFKEGRLCLQNPQTQMYSYHWSFWALSPESPKSLAVSDSKSIPHPWPQSHFRHTLYPDPKPANTTLVQAIQPNFTAVFPNEHKNSPRCLA